MPTGYTAEIKDGITFQQFALNCARAFGACITMRDEPSDTPIPDQFEPSDYHAKAMEKARENLAWLQQMPDSEAEREAANEYAGAMQAHQRRLSEAADLQNKYNTMLAQVMAWTPPTSEHAELKEFMIKQIVDSREFDCSTKYCNEPAKQSGSVWRAAKISDAQHNLEYHTKENMREIERVNQRNEWVRNLRESLKQPSA